MVKNQIQSFRHAGIVVSNIKKTSDIFKNYLGLKLLMKEKIVKGKYISNLVGINNAKIKITIFISIDNIKYELLEYFNKKNSNKLLQSNNIGLSHLSLTVKNFVHFVFCFVAHGSSVKLCFSFSLSKKGWGVAHSLSFELNISSLVELFI